MRRNQGDHAVATEAKPVHPEGQPISASTNRGFSVGVSVQPVPPAVGIIGAGWESQFTACSLSGRLLRAIVSGPANPLRQSRADGVAQQRARPVRSASRRRPALGRLPSLAFAVGHRRNSSVRLAPLERVPAHALGVGQPAGEDEQPFAAMGSADFRR